MPATLARLSNGFGRVRHLCVVEIARMLIRALHNLAIYCSGRAASCGRLGGSDDQFLREIGIKR